MSDLSAVSLSRRSYDSSTGCTCVNEWPSRSPSWSFGVWPARHRRTWQTTVSLPPTSARADSDQPTQRRASSDDLITVSATGVLRLLDHVCGTRYRLIYGCVTVLNSLNGCLRPICLVFETAALCDAYLGAPCINLVTYLLTSLHPFIVRPIFVYLRFIAQSWNCCDQILGLLKMESNDTDGDYVCGWPGKTAV